MKTVICPLCGGDGAMVEGATAAWWSARSRRDLPTRTCPLCQGLGVCPEDKAAEFVQSELLD